METARETSKRGEELPPGLTHPYESRVRTATYQCGYTFTWTQGEEWIAVQRGRVANADKRSLVFEDPLPRIPMQLGRRPVVDAVKAPEGDWWNEHAIVTEKLAATAASWAATHLAQR